MQGLEHRGSRVQRVMNGDLASEVDAYSPRSSDG